MKRWNKVKELWKSINTKELSAYASSASFYIILSLIPSFLLFLEFLSILSFDIHWEPIFRQLLPDPIYPLLIELIRFISSSNSVAILSGSGVIALWSASKGLFAIQDGLHSILKLPRNESYLARRIGAMISFFLLLFLFFLFIIVVILGTQLFSAVPLIIQFIVINRYILVFILFVCIFSLLYLILLSRQLSFRSCLIGGCLVTSGWYLFSFLYSIYVNHFSTTHLIYGTAGSILLGMIWLQICNRMILWGGIISFRISKGNFNFIQMLKSVFFDA